VGNASLSNVYSDQVDLERVFLKEPWEAPSAVQIKQLCSRGPTRELDPGARSAACSLWDVCQGQGNLPRPHGPFKCRVMPLELTLVSPEVATYHPSRQAHRQKPWQFMRHNHHTQSHPLVQDSNQALACNLRERSLTLTLDS
jgi:hypothetical protein